MAGEGGEIAIDKGELFAFIGRDGGDDAVVEEFLVNGVDVGFVHGV